MTTALPTAAEIPSPTPPPQPQLAASQLEDGRRHQTNGDYDLAIAAYLAALAGNPPLEIARQAQYHLAECYSLDAQPLAAAAVWETFVAAYPDDSRLAEVSLMSARAYHAAQLWDQAIAQYQTYLSLQTILADMVYEWIGDCYLGQNEAEQAIASFRQALDAPSSREVQMRVRNKVAASYVALEQHQAAVIEYDALLAAAQADADRARFEYLAGQALAAVGEIEAAHARHRRAVDHYPEAGFAYLSLVELINAGVDVDSFQRGMVDYHAGKVYPDAYEAAIRAFDAYLATEPADRSAEALLRKAAAQRALDLHAMALETLNQLITNHPQSPWLADAWLERGAVLALMGDSDPAVDAYQRMAELFPADDRAPRALWRAAQVRESERAYTQAAQLYEQLQAAFPIFENADEALWKAGLAYYQAGSQDRAVSSWKTLLRDYPESSSRARSLYWLGKLDAPTEAEAGGSYWDQLLAPDPCQYYALRVQQIRAGQPLTASHLITGSIEPPPRDLRQAQAEVITWLNGWTWVPDDTDLSTLPDSLTRRFDFRQAQALLSGGLRREAIRAFDPVRAAAWSDPLALARLAFFFHEQSLHGLAARCAIRLVALSLSNSSHASSTSAMLAAPVMIQRLAYPLAYADLISTTSAAQGLDPLLLAALIRQESLFEPTAQSYAGARGLGQVMPATGEGIAQSLKMEDFELADLFRPSVSIRFGAYYLGTQLRSHDGQLLVALAAYNGGPGNTRRWLEASGDDLDLFVEVISASQSRIYLQRVLEHYVIYQELYRPSEAHRVSG